MAPLFDIVQLADFAYVPLLVAIYAVAAVFGGLCGFGFSAVGAVSLALLPPPVGVALLMALSSVAQAVSVGSEARDLTPHARSWYRRDGVMPYMAGGVLGLPVGLAILTSFGARPLLACLGVLLMGYAVWSLSSPRSVCAGAGVSSMRSAVLVGAAGGVVGGFAAFPGSALVIWNGVVGRTKEQSRALTQPYILFMQVVALLLLAVVHPQLFDPPFWTLFAVCLPGTLAGNHLGLLIFRRTGDRNFRRITLIALGFSGACLLLKVGLS